MRSGGHHGTTVRPTPRARRSSASRSGIEAEDRGHLASAGRGMGPLAERLEPGARRRGRDARLTTIVSTPRPRCWSSRSSTSATGAGSPRPPSTRAPRSASTGSSTRRVHRRGPLRARGRPLRRGSNAAGGRTRWRLGGAARRRAVMAGRAPGKPRASTLRHRTRRMASSTWQAVRIPLVGHLAWPAAIRPGRSI